MDTSYENRPKLRLIVIPKEAKMADIIKSDIQTYVRELIAKEFGTNAHFEKVNSDDLMTNTGGYRNERFQPLTNQPLEKVWI
jgi:hypothetical protein